MADETAERRALVERIATLIRAADDGDDAALTEAADLARRYPHLVDDVYALLGADPGSPRWQAR